MTVAHSRYLPGRIAYPLLLAILLSGFVLRVWNLNFGRAGIGSHPRQRSTACFYATTVKLPASWDEFWDAQRSPMNPLWDVQNQRTRSFTYGHLPLYLGVVMGEVFHRAAPVAAAARPPRRGCRPDGARQRRLRCAGRRRTVDDCSLRHADNLPALLAGGAHLWAGRWAAGGGLLSVSRRRRSN